jgi:hypothetical protein
MRKKILFITGSQNQTTQMHQIAGLLAGEYDCWFSQVFTDSLLLHFIVHKTPLANGTVIAPHFRRHTEAYLRRHNLQIDYAARLNTYDLVVYCSDMIVPRRMLQTKTLWVQEGMTDPYTLLSRIVKFFRLPSFFSGGTSLNGTSDKCDIYCAASPGYRQLFARRGTKAEKIFVTGIPNYDFLAQHTRNNFPYRDYVMVATSDMRETFRYDNRAAFIKRCATIARGRTLLFKLHPNENRQRAIAEIKQHAPKGTLIFSSGNTYHMIANCSELITQYSTVVYAGLALGKKVHSCFRLSELQAQLPIQNNGTSAANIANICRAYLEHKGTLQQFLQTYRFQPVPFTAAGRRSSNRPSFQKLTV